MPGLIPGLAANLLALPNTMDAQFQQAQENAALASALAHPSGGGKPTITPEEAAAIFPSAPPAGSQTIHQAMQVPVLGQLLRGVGTIGNILQTTLGYTPNAPRPPAEMLGVLMRERAEQARQSHLDFNETERLRMDKHRFDEDEQGFANGKAFDQVLEPGDAYILRSGGGGGFGSPLDRDLTALERDVRCGYVTKEAAERDYGAVFEPGTLKIDVAATGRRRDEMRARGLPKDEPIADTGVPLPAPAHHHHHDHAHEKLTEEERVALAMTGRCCS